MSAGDRLTGFTFEPLHQLIDFVVSRAPVPVELVLPWFVQISGFIDSCEAFRPVEEFIAQLNLIGAWADRFPIVS